MAEIANGELDSLLRAFSAGRLEPYVLASGGRLDLAFRLYAWNVEVSAAFAGPLHCLEVVLRNAMHRALCAHFGREDWWHHPRIRLHSTAMQSIASASEKINRRHKEVTADRLVAELPLGFWVALLGRGLNYETQLWRPALRAAFPHYTGERAALHEEVETMRRLRNRISHLEPFTAGTTSRTITRFCASSATSHSMSSCSLSATSGCCPCCGAGDGSARAAPNRRFEGLDHAECASGDRDDERHRRFGAGEASDRE